MKHIEIEDSYLHEHKAVAILRKENRVITCIKNDEGGITIEEACDNYFGADYTVNEFVEMLDELKKWALSEEKQSGRKQGE